MTSLERRAARAGVTLYWRDAFGKVRRVAPDTLRVLVAALERPASALPPLVTAEVGRPIELGAAVRGTPAFRIDLEHGGMESGRAARGARGAWLPPVTSAGYHRLLLGERELTLAVAPQRCFTLADCLPREGGSPGKLWAIAAQLYGLRTPGDGGLAHYAAVAALARSAARHGASALALSPVHAMFAALPGQCSPYSPSSRRFYNVLYGDAGVWERPLAARVRQLERAPLVDWVRAGRLRLARLRQEFKLDEAHPAFHAWRAQRGASLEAHARFEALHARLERPWQKWPREFRHAGGRAVTRFALANPREVAFHAFLQWRAELGLARAQAAALAAGMQIGLISDLAIGSDPAGSDAWCRPDEVLRGVSIGAPPDRLGPQGQDWGLAALSPAGMREAGYAAFLEVLRAAFAHAGGVRIDHVMGLMRLWLVPRGARATDGAYLQYPMTDLLRLLALESWRHRAIVIGEDLGTVPAGFRDVLARAGILGMRVMPFERGTGGRFRAPRAYDPRACALTTTHDLPTMQGWWRGRDIDWRERLGLFGEGSNAGSERAVRQRDHVRFAAACATARIAAGPPAQRAAEFIGKSAAPLAILPLEDALGLVEQPNLPGTIDEHPNWRRRYPGNAATLLERPGPRTILRRLARARR